MERPKVHEEHCGNVGFRVLTATGTESQTTERFHPPHCESHWMQNETKTMSLGPKRVEKMHPSTNAHASTCHSQGGRTLTLSAFYGFDETL